MSLFFTRPDRSFHPGAFPMPRVVRVCVPDAPKYLHGLRALFVSDVHLRRSVSDDRLQALTALMAAQKADLLLLGGDYAEGTDQCLRFFEALQNLSFPLGGFAVPGNNDFDSMPSLHETAAAAGVELLCNTSRRISLPGGEIEIGGCDDHEYGSPQTRALFGDADSAYRILLSHFPIMPDCACELMLSGHTHAGQFNLCGVTPYSIGFEFTYRLLGVRGMRKIGNMHLLVGNGIGVSRILLRIGAEPQIYLLEFGSKDFF